MRDTDTLCDIHFDCERRVFPAACTWCERSRQSSRWRACPSRRLKRCLPSAPVSSPPVSSSSRSSRGDQNSTSASLDEPDRSNRTRRIPRSSSSRVSCQGLRGVSAILGVLLKNTGRHAEDAGSPADGAFEVGSQTRCPGQNHGISTSGPAPLSFRGHVSHPAGRGANCENPEERERAPFSAGATQLLVCGASFHLPVRGLCCDIPRSPPPDHKMAAPDEPTRRVEVPIVDGISDDSRCRSVSEEERRRRCAAFAALNETFVLGTTTTRRDSHDALEAPPEARSSPPPRPSRRPPPPRANRARGRRRHPSAIPRPEPRKTPPNDDPTTTTRTPLNPRSQSRRLPTSSPCSASSTRRSRARPTTSCGGNTPGRPAPTNHLPKIS